MPMLDRTGTFLAHPIGQAIPAPKDGWSLQAHIRFAIEFEADPSAEGGWRDVSGEQREITAFRYLEEKDGSVNVRELEMLRDIFGCPPHNPYWLEDNDLSDKRVQLVVDQGKNGKPRVAFINPEDYAGHGGGGGIKKTDDAGRRAVMNKFGAKLRAVFGAPAQAPKPPARPAAKPPADAMPSAEDYGQQGS